MENPQYWTPHQIVESDRYPFTMGQLRHLLLFRHKNGLKAVTRKIGKRLMIRMDQFDQWIEEQSEGKNG